MARLKAGSTVGGSTILTQGMIALVPSGNSITYKGFLMYTQNDKPTKADVGLGNVNNWLASSSINNTSDTTYATAGAVKKAYDLANTKIPLSSLAQDKGTSKDLVMSQNAVTANLETQLGKVGGVVGNLTIEHPANPNFPALTLRKTSDNRYVVLETTAHTDGSYFNIIYREANGTNIAVMKFPKESSTVASQAWVDSKYYKNGDTPTFSSGFKIKSGTSELRIEHLADGVFRFAQSKDGSGNWMRSVLPTENGTLATREWSNTITRHNGSQVELISPSGTMKVTMQNNGTFSTWNGNGNPISVDVAGNTSVIGTIQAVSTVTARTPNSNTIFGVFVRDKEAFLSLNIDNKWVGELHHPKTHGTIATQQWSNGQHYAKTETYTRSEVDSRDNQRVPNGRTVNGKALSANITLTSGDVGAYAKGETYTRAEMDTRYPLKTNVYAKGETYTRAEVDSRVNGRLTQAQGDARYVQKANATTTIRNMRKIGTIKYVKWDSWGGQPGMVYDQDLNNKFLSFSGALGNIFYSGQPAILYSGQGALEGIYQINGSTLRCTDRDFTTPSNDLSVWEYY